MKKGRSNESNSTQAGAFSHFDAISYIFGRTQYFIEVYAAGNGLSADELAIGLAALLSASASRQALGSAKRMPTLRRTSTKRNEKRKMAVDGHSRSKAQVRKDRRGAPLTPKRLAAMRRSAKLARAALAAKRAAAA